MIWKVLRKNISVWQIAGYAVATLIGLVILLVAVQFYRDVAPALSGGDDDAQGIALAGNRNIVIYKTVGLSATMSGRAPTFSDTEIAQLRRQPWAEAVQPFQSADFAVHAGLQMGGRGMSTALFFESVPDDVLDISPEKWTFDSVNPSVPIILSKDYLTLYNFGFAASGGMPVLTEGMVGSVPLTITLAGNGQRATLPGRIAGFSSTLNTVAVPQAFMDWAHARFGDGSRHEPSRLVVTLTREGDPGVAQYLDSRGYEVAGGDRDLGRTSFFVALLVSVVGGVGALITALALGILVLSIYLLVQKNRKAISALLLLGFTPAEVSRRYIALVGAVNGLVTLMACATLPFAASLWRGALDALGIAGVSLFAAIACGVGLMLVITLVNAAVIRRLVARCFRQA